jgi:hypothetical protein
VRSFIENMGIKLHNLKRLNKPFMKSAAYKVHISALDVDIALNKKNWPQNVTCSYWQDDPTPRPQFR